MSKHPYNDDEIEAYLLSVLGPVPITGNPISRDLDQLKRNLTTSNLGGRDSVKEVKYKELGSGSKGLVQSIKSKDWQGASFRRLVSFLTQRYIAGCDASYRRGLVPVFRALSASDAEVTIAEMGSSILTHLSSNSRDVPFLVDGAQLISQLLDFEVGREVIQANLELISEWNRNFLVNFSTTQDSYVDVLYGFRNLTILSTKFRSPSTAISREVEELAIIHLLSGQHPQESVILIALAVATSIVHSDRCPMEKIYRAKEVLERSQQLEFAFICFGGSLISTFQQGSLVGSDGSPSLLDAIFINSFSILGCTTSTACRIQCFQVLSNWMIQTARALMGEYQALARNISDVAISKTDELLTLVWTYWDDTSDSLGVAVSEFFTAFLKFHKAINEPKFQVLLDKLTSDVMQFDWHRKIRYAILGCLLPHLDCEVLLTSRPTLVIELLRAYQSSALATRATDCLCQIFIRHSVDEFWVAPIGLGISSPDSILRRNLSTFLLPKLAKIDLQLMLRLVAWLQSPAANGRHCQHGAIAATKTAIATGALPGDDCLDKMWPCLFHADLAVRIDMLGLVSACQKTTAAVTRAELDAVRQAFPLSANCASPDFRQKFHGHLLKLLTRLRASQAVLLRLQNPSPEAKESISRQSEFLVWVEHAALASLYPGASYQRVSSSLKLIESVMRIAGIQSTPNTFKQLVHVLTSPYDSCRLLASSLLVGQTPALSPDTLVDWAVSSLSSPRAKECASGAAALDYVFRVVIIQQDKYVPLCASVKKYPPVSAFAHELLVLIDKALDVASSSISDASFSSPTHGLFVALQHVLLTLEGQAPHVALYLNFWKEYIQRCLQLTTKMFSIGQVALLSSSPDDASLSLSEDQPNNALESVLSFSWRGVKEAATTLEILVTKLPTSISPLNDAAAAGAALQGLMVDLRHRGAFSALMPCFRSICARLLRSPSSSVVESWLESGLNKLARADASITQRSAGLPLCIIAILDALPLTDHSILLTTTQQLFWLAKVGQLLPQDKTFDDFSATEACEEAVLPRVHGLNVLRAVFQDSGVGPTVFDRFGPLGLVLAATGLGSGTWAIRNSSVLLFSTLLIRVFGIKRVRDEHDPRNSLTLREFFARFSALEPFLLQSLSDGAIALHVPPPGLFPTLTLLARLHPTIDDNPKCQASLVAGVENCASSPICKVRELAATALASLTHPTHLAGTLIRLIGQLVTTNLPNQSHGFLLMVLELSRSILDLEGVEGVAREFDIRLDALLKNSQFCTYRRRVLYQIWASLASSSADPSSPRGNLFTRLETQIHRKDLGFHEKLPLVQLIPSFTWLEDPDYEVRERALELITERQMPASLHQKVIALVQSPDPHLGTLIQALKCLSNQTCPFPKDLLVQSHLAPSLYNLATRHPSMPVRAAALPLFSAMLIQNIGSTLILDFSRLLKLLSHPSSDVYLREATGLAVSHLIPWFKTLPALPDPDVDQVTAHIFRATVYLLQDDDEDIRLQVAQSFHAAGLVEGEMSPEKCLEFLFQVSTIPSHVRVTILLEFLTPESSLDRQLEAIVDAQGRSLFEIEKPNYYAEPLITCQLAFHSLRQLFVVNSAILPVAQASMNALIKKTCHELEALLKWVSETPVLSQIRLGGPLGIFAHESIFQLTYQSLLVLRLAVQPAFKTLKWDMKNKILGICSRFLAFGEDTSFPIHPLILALARSYPERLDESSCSKLENAEGFLTSYS